MNKENIFAPKKGSIEENLLGLTLNNSNLYVLKNSKIVIRADHESLNQVKILSGGGSGHDPAMSGFIGQGFLSASVSGEIFAAPSSSDIFRAIVELGKHHKAGVLIIFLNYTGDRLNFGLAVERARSIDINVEMCIVNDDCAIKDYIPSVGKRGLAGAILINKIAGALSDFEWNLKDIYSFINNLLIEKKLQSIGISINDENVELGKGVHGEPGSQTLQLHNQDYSSMVQIMLEKLFEELLKINADIFILLNNLGGLSPCDIYNIRNEIANQLLSNYKTSLNSHVVRIYCGSYLTSLNVKGFSISILLADQIVTKCIDHECKTEAWKNSFITLDKYKYLDIFAEDKYSTESEILEAIGSQLSNEGIKMVSRSLHYLCEALISCEKQLNIIDSEVGDGDTGSTIARGAAEILRLLENNKLNLNYPEILLTQLSKVAEQFMGGTSGALYSILFQAASLTFRHCKKLDVTSWISALQKGIEAIECHAQSKVGDRTMLDPLHAVLNVLILSANRNLTEFRALELATEAAEQVALNTINMEPQVGRAVYSKKSIDRKHPDSGAHAVGIWMRAICEAIRTFTF